MKIIRKIACLFFIAILIVAFFLSFNNRSRRQEPQPGHIAVYQPGQIGRVELMPNIPSPFMMRDWRKVAHDYDAFAFDFDRTGEYLPLIAWDTDHLNFDRDTFSMPSYVGREYSDEAINCIAAVVSATLVGIDKSDQSDRNWVLMCENWYNIETRQYLYLNNRYAFTGGSFWYELLPNVFFYELAYFYPDTGDFQDEMRVVADRWYNACAVMGGSGDPWAVPDFYYTAFDFNTMKPVYNGEWAEPDAAAAIGWLEYMAWLKWGAPEHLTAADWCLQYLEKIEYDPLYEILLPYGAYAAARMNAELGRNYDIPKIINWCFGPSDVRPGWGVIAENWGGFDCYGLHGSITDNGGYAFAMGTFENVGCLVPLTRYDDRYARAIGKYVLNAANAARLFYGNGLDDEHQDSDDWIHQYDADYCIGYEGLRKEWGGISPLATGDVNQDRYADQTGPTNLGLYGSSHVGIFGSIIRPTNDEKILQLNCLATDYYRDAAYPTYLYYNPYEVEKAVEIDVGPDVKDLYDATTDCFLETGVSGLTYFTLPADSGAVVVVAPANGTIGYDGNKKLINGVVVDYITPSAVSTSFTGEGRTASWEISMKVDFEGRRHRIDLTNIKPCNDLASTEYCLGNLGTEYLVYVPEGTTAEVDITDTVRHLQVEWFNPATGSTKAAGHLTGGRIIKFHSPRFSHI